MQCRLLGAGVLSFTELMVPGDFGFLVELGESACYGDRLTAAAAVDVLKIEFIEAGRDLSAKLEADPVPTVTGAVSRGFPGGSRSRSRRARCR
jgi:hypothetical protein